MRFIKKALWVCSFTTAGLIVLGCNKQPKYELTEFINYSAQVRSFGINSESNKDLAQYTFSIDNTGEVGIISNTQPLPYGTELKDVTLPIQLVQEGSVTLSIGTGQATEWTSDKKYNIPTGTELTLHISHPKKPEYRYSYKVKINQYSYDPESISWQEKYSGVAGSILGGDTQGFVFVNPQDGANYFTQSGSNVFYRLNRNQAPQPTAFTGLQTGDKIKRIASLEQAIYALGTSGQLYMLGANNTWSLLPGAEGVQELLGVFPAYGAGQSKQLALLIGNNSGGKDYALYRNGSILRGNKAAEDFPGQNAEDRFYSYGTSAEYEGGSLKLIATRTSTEAGKSIRSVWYSSNGTAWAREYSVALTGKSPKVFSPALVDDTYYRLEAEGQEVAIYYSQDKSNWTRSKDIALTGLPAVWSASNALMWAESGMLYILTVDATGTLKVWQGELLKTKTNP